MELSLKDVLQILLKRIWVLLICTAVGLVGALFISMFILRPEYTSISQLYVNPNQSQTDQTGNINDLQYAQRLVNSYLIILRNSMFLDQVAQSSGLRYSPADIESMLSLSSINNTEIFEVKVSAPDPAHAQKLVNTIVALAPAEILRIRENDTVKVITAATLPTSPSSPNTMMNTAIGAVLGLMISAVAVFLIEMLDTRVKSEEDLIDHYKIPVIGSIPKFDEH